MRLSEVGADKGKQKEMIWITGRAARVRELVPNKTMRSEKMDATNQNKQYILPTQLRRRL